MVAGLFDPAKVSDVRILVAYDKAKDFGVEAEAFGKIFDEIAHMAGAGDVKGWRRRDWWYAHESTLLHKMVSTVIRRVG